MTQFSRIDAILTALGDAATVEEIEYALRDFGDREVRAVLAERAAAGAVGGVAVLEDPGVAWQPDHVYAEGDLFAETIEDELRVFEITTAGTSGGGAFLDYGTPSLVPNAEWGTGSEAFRYRGVVGQLGWTILPILAGGLTLGPEQNPGNELIYTSKAPPEESQELFALRATVDDVPVPVFEAQTDGDADWYLDVNAGAGFRFNLAEDGVPVVGGGLTQITTDGLLVGKPGGVEFYINYDPDLIRILNLPTADPGVGHAGELWVDVAAGRVLKVSAG